jgi:hypothetical protein
MKERHLKMVVAGERGRPLEAVWWNCLDRLERTPGKNERIEVAYTIESSLWDGLIQIQLNVEDVVSQ